VTLDNHEKKTPPKPLSDLGEKTSEKPLTQNQKKKKENKTGVPT